MAIRIRRSPNYVDGVGIKMSGTTGGVKMRAPGGGGDLLGSLANPYTLLTDGTPLSFTIDSNVTAQYREFDASGTPFYGRYVKFTCPVLGMQLLDINFGVQTDIVDYLDTYMYVFEASTVISGAPGSWNLIDYDDDGGAGDYDVFPNTYVSLSAFDLTPGVDYIIEATTYDTNDVSNVKMIATLVGV